MTKVQVRFRLQKPLDDSSLSKLSAANAMYGILRVKLAPTLDSMEVEYDATRLKAADVMNALAVAGITVIAGS